MRDRCSRPRCRHPVEVRHLGKDYCDRHWRQMAEREQCLRCGRDVPDRDLVDTEWGEVMCWRCAEEIERATAAGQEESEVIQLGMED